MAKIRRSEPAQMLYTDIQSASGAHICEQTIRNRLRDVSFHAWRPVFRPLLTPAHRKIRLDISLEHQNIPLDRLTCILFMESKFCVDFYDGRRHVWRQQNERFRDCCIVEHNRFVVPGCSFGVACLTILRH